MTKSIFSVIDNATLLSRMEKLEKDKECAWGSMSVSAMLYHCNFTNKAILKARPSSRKRTLKQHLLKFLVFNIKKEIPKGIKGNPKFFSQDSETLNFEEQKEEWKRVISGFTKVEGPLAGEHPKFGRLDTKDWGRFVWLHMDHHLRQFGV